MNEATNVTKIEDHRPAPTATHVISYVLDGFQITSTIETSAPIRQIVDRLKAIGAEPPNFKSPVGELKSAPLCPTHSTPMAPSTRRPGTYYCKSSVGQAEDGRTIYCTKKA